MADRDLTRAGVQVDFFGQPTRMPAGAAKLAIETGAALLPTHCWYKPDSWRVDIHPPVDTSSEDVGAITQALADLFARSIAAHPADWHMLQPQWLADLSDERRAQLGADLMRIGMVCPYSFDVPGGVQSHVLQLAEVMRAAAMTSACSRRRHRT